MSLKKLSDISSDIIGQEAPCALVMFKISSCKKKIIIIIKFDELKIGLQWNNNVEVIITRYLTTRTEPHDSGIRLSP